MFAIKNYKCINKPVEGRNNRDNNFVLKFTVYSELVLKQHITKSHTIQIKILAIYRVKIYALHREIKTRFLYYK